MLSAPIQLPRIKRHAYHLIREFRPYLTVPVGVRVAHVTGHGGGFRSCQERENPARKETKRQTIKIEYKKQKENSKKEEQRRRKKKIGRGELKLRLEVRRDAGEEKEKRR